MGVLVTGAAGFIGSHLVDRLLAQGEDVVGVDDLSSGSLANLRSARSSSTGKFSFGRVDVTSTAIADHIRRQRPQIIYHLAAQVDEQRSVGDPIHDATVNVIGTLNVLHAAVDAEVEKVVFTTSAGAIYGCPDPRRLPVTEDQIYDPEAVPASPFAVSKRIVLEYLRLFRVSHGLDFTALALAHVYGPRQEPAGDAELEGQVVAAIARRLLAGRPYTLYGAEATRDLIYVDDAVSALVAARDRAGGELLNIGTGIEVPLRELYDKLALLTATRLAPVLAPSRPGALERFVVDPARAAGALDWTPAMSLDDGLTQTVAYFRSTS